MPSLVSIRTCPDYDLSRVYHSVKSAIDHLGGMGRFVKKGERILLKPNLLSAKEPEKAVTTHPSVVEAVIRLVMKEGAIPLVGDSPGIGRIHKVAEKAGILSVCRRYGVRIVEFRESVKVDNKDSKMINPQGLFRSIALAREALEVDGIINLPKVKTHAQMFLTLAVKNMFGCVVGKRKVQWHLAAGRDQRAFAGLLVDIYRLLNPRLNVADAIVAMEGNGPGSGDPRKVGIIFASVDGIAMDRVITRVLGAKEDQLPTTRVAMERGLAEDVALVGDEVRRMDDFRFPPRMIDVGWELPGPLKRRLRNALTPYPQVNHKSCTLCRICVETCPIGAMAARDSRIWIDLERCIRCFCCQEICPEGAIASKEGLMARILARI